MTNNTEIHGKHLGSSSQMHNESNMQGSAMTGASLNHKITNQIIQSPLNSNKPASATQ